MKVSELMRALSKMDPDAKVGVAHHDNSENEIAGTVKSVLPFDPETSFDPSFCRNVGVVLRT